MKQLSPDLSRWMLEGDPSIVYQYKKDLRDVDDQLMQRKIETEGWGAAILSRRREDGHWGRAFYQPKWTSTHYTLLQLKNFLLPRDNSDASQTVDLILKNEKGADGGINPSETISQSDLCINGMVLNYASWFGADRDDLKSLVEIIIHLQMGDGGFNCLVNRSGAVHSSLHTTINVLEGIREYIRQGYEYRRDDLLRIEKEAREFILRHRLYKSDKTGKIINKAFTMLSYPCRWHYDVLRAMVYFAESETPYDERMSDAIDLIISKRRKDGTWPVQANHTGKTHIEMEKAGGPSRWNTLRALKVLNFYNRLEDS